MNGSIDHRPDRPRPWRARYSAPGGRQVSKSWKTKVEAQRWLREEISRIDRGSWVDPAGGAMLYGEYAELWLAGKLNIKEKTRHWYNGILRSRLIPAFGRYQIRHLGAPTIRSWVSDLVEEGLSAARIRHLHQVLRTSLQQAVKDGLLTRNPADGIDLPTERHREMQFLDAGQLHELARYAEGMRSGQGTMIIFLGYSGLRWSELVALRYRSVDLLNRRIHVTEAATDVGGRLVFDSPKSHRRRTVVLPRSVAHLIEDRLESASPDKLVFTAPEGGPLRSSNYRQKIWVPSVASLAVDHPHLRGLRIHDLRHSAASMAISCGANIKVIQRMLGHRHASMTLDRYGHLYTEDLEDVADRLDVVFRGAA